MMVFTATTAVTAFGGLAGVRVNTTDSIPLGIYQLTGKTNYRRGEIVLLCPPKTQPFQMALSRGYISSGFCPHGFEPLFKPVGAVEGDIVTVSKEGISVNNTALPNTELANYDAKGQRLGHADIGAHLVTKGQVWLISTHNKASFDSRYFGPVNQSHLHGSLTPIFVRGA